LGENIKTQGSWLAWTASLKRDGRVNMSSSIPITGGALKKRG